MLDEGNTAYVP